MAVWKGLQVWRLQGSAGPPQLGQARSDGHALQTMSSLVEEALMSGEEGACLSSSCAAAWSCVWVAPRPSVGSQDGRAAELELVQPLSGTQKQGDRGFWKPCSLGYISYVVIKT